MFGKQSNKRKQRVQTQQEGQQRAAPAKPGQLSTSLDENIALMDKLFLNVDTMLSRRFQNSRDADLDYCIYFSDGVVDSQLINEHIIEPLLQSKELEPGPALFERVRDRFVMMNDVKQSADVQEIIEAITYGDTLLLIDTCDRALILSSKNFTLRSVQEPEGEKVLSGPREGFTEGIMLNLSMLRRRLRTNELKLRFHPMGRQTHTAVCICYMDNIVNHTILDELYRRLEAIDIDGVLDSNYIAELITEPSAMGFARAGTTERPDVVVAKLLEGRIALIVDGSPMVLTLPYLFIENFQSNEDYYSSTIYATFSRLLRVIGFFLTVSIPGLYIAVMAYHPEMLPAALMINITNERQSVPLPASVEAVVMLIIFDILRETGVRMPSHVGQALSIVGALVIGQAAVEAKLVAAPMIIMVAFTGITNLLVPRLASASIFCRYLLLVLAINFGMLGLVIGQLFVFVHIINLQTMGLPAMMQTDRLGYQRVKDTLFRASWKHMLLRTPPISQNLVRARPKQVQKKEDGTT